MVEASSLAALDVAIGLGLLIFILCIVCSAINETIASILNLRGRYLEYGLRRMLGPSSGPLVDKLAEHPLIKGMTSGRRFPSYLNRGTFALSLLDTIVAPVTSGEPPVVASPRNEESDLIQRVEKSVRQLPAEDALKRVLEISLEQAGGSQERLKASLETWFDLTMDRVSGWYRRRVQITLLLIAAIICLAANVDTFRVAERLWQDDTLRVAVMAEATRADPAGCSDELVAPAERAAECYEHIEELGIPLGWSQDTIPEPNAGDILGKLFGIVVTVAAVSFGAPFWFDLLGKVANVRTSGRRESSDGARS